MQVTTTTGYTITLEAAQAALDAEQAILDAGFEADYRPNLWGEFFGPETEGQWLANRHRAIAGYRATIARCVGNGGWCWI